MEHEGFKLNGPTHEFGHPAPLAGRGRIASAMRSIVRCNPGEGDSRRVELAERAPHPNPLIPTVAAIDSLRHPRMSAIALTREVRAKRASKDGNMNRLAAILRGPRKERGHLRVNAIAFIPGMTVIVWCRWYKSELRLSRPREERGEREDAPVMPASDWTTQ